MHPLPRFLNASKHVPRAVHRANSGARAALPTRTAERNFACVIRVGWGTMAGPPDISQVAAELQGLRKRGLNATSLECVQRVHPHVNIGHVGRLTELPATTTITTTRNGGGGGGVCSRRKRGEESRIVESQVGGSCQAAATPAPPRSFLDGRGPVSRIEKGFAYPLLPLLLFFFPFLRLDHPLSLSFSLLVRRRAYAFCMRVLQRQVLHFSSCATPLSLSFLLLLLYSVAFLRQHEAPLTRGNLLFFLVFLNTRNGEFPWARPEGKFLNLPVPSSGSNLSSPRFNMIMNWIGILRSTLFAVRTIILIGSIAM